MDFSLPIVGIAIVGNTFLSIFTLSNNPKNSTNRLFFLFTTCLTIYLAVNYLSTIQQTDSGAFFWIKMVMTIALLINLLFFLLSLVFPDRKLGSHPNIVLGALVSTLILIPAAQFNLIFTSAKAHAASGVPGPAIPFFLLHTIVLLGGGFAILIRRYFRSSGRVKTQLRFLVFGSVLMFVFILVTNVLFVLLLNTGAFVGLLPLYALIFISAISYAIVRHRFLDINLIIARTIAFSVLLLIIGGFYSLAFILIGATLFSIPFSIQSVLFYSAVTFFVAITFGFLKNGVEKGTDKIFFKGEYSLDQLLSSLTTTMTTNIELQTLTQKILEALILEMRLSRGVLVLLKEQSIYDVIIMGEGKDIKLTYQEIRPLLTIKNIIVFDEIDEGPTKQLLREMDVNISKTLTVNDKVVGLLLLGGKASGEIYSDRDVRLLEILAPEAAIAIQNAQSVDEIKRFNVTLTQEVQKATKDLQVANKRLEDLDHLKDDFVSIASHELRTPMTAIRSYAWMALNRSDIPLSEKLKKYISRTLISTERLINLVNEMLNISRIESGKLDISPAPFDIYELLQDIYSEVEIKLKEKNLKLEIAKCAIKVFADPNKVHQVLLNLIGNAMKFTPEMGTIEINFFSDGHMLETSIKDSGVGISKEDLSALFKKFGRLDNSYVAAATTGGSGLGLYISKSLIELMHGKIWASSEGVGKGTTFTFSLPLATQDVLSHPERYKTSAIGEAKGLETVAI